MAKTLANTLRPKSFKTVFGQETVITAIRKQMASKRIPQAWLFSGEPGSGKTSIAMIMGTALNCTHIPKNKFGSFCKICYKIKEEFQVAKVNAAKNRTVEAMESIVNMATYAPVPPAIKRVIIVDEAQRLSREAQDLLLHPFEFPPPDTIWIICTTEVYKIAPALRSRCLSFALSPLKHSKADEFIKQSAIRAGITRDTDELLEFIHKQHITSPRNMLNMLEKYAAGMDPDRAAAAAPMAVNTLRIANGILTGEWGPCRAELDRATPDDVAVIRAALMGFFKYKLLQHGASSRKMMVYAIEQLADIPFTIDEPSRLALLSARIYNLSQEFMKKV